MRERKEGRVNGRTRNFTDQWPAADGGGALTLSSFLEPFFPKSDEPINLRFLCPREGNPKEAIQGDGDYQAWPRSRTVTREILANDTRIQETLKDWNKQRGAYFIVNVAGEILSGDPEPGGYVDQAITGGVYEDKKKGTKTTYAPGRFTACFAEADDKSIPEQHALLDACPLQPSARLVTYKSVHAYWLLAGDNPGDQCEADWREVQARFIGYFGSDDKIKNPARLMRLPFLNHLKLDLATRKNTATKVKLVVFEPERRYALAELLAAFPPALEEKQGAKTGSKSKQGGAGMFATWDALRAELGRRIEAHESASKNSSGKVDCRGICHAGEGGTGLFYDPAMNQAHCNDGCDQAAILRAFGLPDKPDSSAKKKTKQANASATTEDGGQEGGRQTQADMLIEIAEVADLLYSVEEDLGYASIEVNGHQETHRINSKPFRQYLARDFYRQYNKVPNSEAMQNALNFLDGRARFDCPSQSVYLRLAAHDGRIYWDLANEQWQIVEISAGDWRLIESKNAPMRFRRSKGMQALPAPVKGGDLGALKRFVNYPDNASWVLHATWLVAALRANARAFPILILNGEQGSAKSTASKMTRALIDPNVADLRPKPREDRDLYIAARNGWVCAFDNLSGLPREFSDSVDPNFRKTAVS